jgi:hypothetical protein
MFRPATLRATDKLFRSRPWAGTPDEKNLKFRRWLIRASSAYGMEVPEFAVVPPVECYLWGCYDTVGRTIFLPRHSVVTLLHEFRHHMQNVHLRPRPWGYMGAEHDARAWSQSLFYQVRPELFTKARDEGRILH